MEPEPIFYWHIHHDTLMEPRCGPIGDRIAYIRRAKPDYQVPTRLRFLKAVRGRLNGVLAMAGEEYVAAEQLVADTRRARGNAQDALDSARMDLYDAPWFDLRARWAFYKARFLRDRKRDAEVAADAWRDKSLKTCNYLLRIFRPEIEALHKQECPNCPWDGNTIFPEQDGY